MKMHWGWRYGSAREKVGSALPRPLPPSSPPYGPLTVSFKINLGCWGGSSLLQCGLSLVVAARGPLFIAMHGLLVGGGFSCCGAQALGARASVVVPCGP